MPRIDFPARRIAGPAEAGRSLHEAVRRLGHVLDYACGGNALCGTCCVRVVSGMEHLTRPGPRETARLEDLDLAEPHRLACQARLLPGEGEVILVVC